MAARCSPDAAPRVASVSFPEGAGCGDQIGSFTFSARQRLRDKAEFDHVYKSGQRYGQALFQAVAAANSLGHARLGLSIAARSVGDSVERNRIRRLVRETFRLQQHELPPIDLIVAARAAARGASTGALRADLVLLLATIISRCASSSSRSSRPGAGS